MSDWSNLIQNALAGLLTGGAGATSTLLAFFKDVKKRLENVEKTIGSAGSSIEPKTGFFLLAHQLTDTVESLREEVKKLRRGFDNLEEDPPEWFTRAMNRRPSYTPSHSEDYEHVAKMAKTALDRIKQVEDELERVRDDIDKLSRDYVGQDKYDHDSTKRAEEILRIRENINTVNGFLRGVMATLGYIDATPTPPSPPQQLPPPRRK